MGRMGGLESIHVKCTHNQLKTLILPLVGKCYQHLIKSHELRCNLKLTDNLKQSYLSHSFRLFLQ